MAVTRPMPQNGRHTTQTQQPSHQLQTQQVETQQQRVQLPQVGQHYHSDILNKPRYVSYLVLVWTLTSWAKQD